MRRRMPAYDLALNSVVDKIKKKPEGRRHLGQPERAKASILAESIGGRA